MAGVDLNKYQAYQETMWGSDVVRKGSCFSGVGTDCFLPEVFRNAAHHVQVQAPEIVNLYTCVDWLSE